MTNDYSSGIPFIIIVGRDTVRENVVEVIDRHVDVGANARRISIDDMEGQLHNYKYKKQN